MTQQNDNSDWEVLEEFLSRYADVAQQGLEARWAAIDVKLYETELYEVIGGLMARQVTLSTHLALSPGIWNPDIAHLVLRSMTDAHITLAWILMKPSERVREYILYGLGQAKLQVEHLRNELSGDDEEDGPVRQTIEAYERWIESQRASAFTEVNLGSWSGSNTRTMAIEANCESLYKFAYVPFTATAHNMWNHVGYYNVLQCRNPLHKFHRVPFTGTHPISNHFLYLSAKYLTRTFKLVDQTFALDISVPLPLRWYNKEAPAIFS